MFFEETRFLVFGSKGYAAINEIFLLKFDWLIRDRRLIISNKFFFLINWIGFVKYSSNYARKCGVKLIFITRVLLFEFQ